MNKTEKFKLDHYPNWKLHVPAAKIGTITQSFPVEGLSNMPRKFVLFASVLLLAAIAVRADDIV
ncbi:MAG TPA: hypothetical protein VFP11_06825, partial [Candidatus Angelobacter sp.]|nr:hypothetical protein [Candidatus Angelobacter sp.]